MNEDKIRAAFDICTKAVVDGARQRLVSGFNYKVLVEIHGILLEEVLPNSECPLCLSRHPNKEIHNTDGLVKNVHDLKATLTEWETGERFLLNRKIKND